MFCVDTPGDWMPKRLELMKLFRVGTPGDWVPKSLEVMEKFRVTQDAGGF